MRPRLKIPPRTRRGFLATVSGLFGSAVLTGCDRFADSAFGERTLKLGEDANLFVQRLILKPAPLAREFSETDISPWFKPNGTTDPEDRAYKALAAEEFASWRLRLDGLVERPLALSLAELRALPSRTQITRHDCVEGWSAIGKWTGVPLAHLLEKAGLKPEARYVVLRCADTMDYEGGGLEGGDEVAAADSADSVVPASALAAPEEDTSPKGRPVRYYESIDLVDAFHPQTLLAYALNGQPLPVSNGAPLRLRVERQLGYKQAKYVMRIEVVASLDGIGGGKGGYWEDNGYDWYAGI